MLNTAFAHKRRKEDKQDENLEKKCVALLTSESSLFSTSDGWFFLAHIRDSCHCSLSRLLYNIGQTIPCKERTKCL